MPSFDQHCAESVTLFGNPFCEVHKWLDEFFEWPEYGIHHRRLRHHETGINEVRKRWGDEAAKAAKQHIISDLKTEGWKEGSDQFPKDKWDYLKMGLF